MSDKPVYRPAKSGDSRFIAEMIDISSDGIALIEWTEAAQAAGGRTALDVGAESYASEEDDYSYRNCILAEGSGRKAGMLLSFPTHARSPADAVKYDSKTVNAHFPLRH